MVVGEVGVRPLLDEGNGSGVEKELDIHMITTQEERINGWSRRKGNKMQQVLLEQMWILFETYISDIW